MIAIRHRFPEFGGHYFFSYRIIFKNVAIVDPGWDSALIHKKAQDLGVNLSAILLTHDHYDHIGALHDVLRLYGGTLPIYISSENQNEGLRRIDNIIPCKNLSHIN